MFHRHAILAAHPFIEGRSFLTTLWRGYAVFGHMHATAETFSKAMGRERRVEHLAMTFNRYPLSLQAFFKKWRRAAVFWHL